MPVHSLRADRNPQELVARASKRSAASGAAARLARMPFDPQASFGKSLFFGDILEDQLFPYPQMDEDSRETVREIVEATGKYMAGIDTARLDRTGEMPAELLQSRRAVSTPAMYLPV